eukprot:4848391-Pleurochrysis_carterae.AAC.2
MSGSSCRAERPAKDAPTMTTLGRSLRLLASGLFARAVAAFGASKLDIFLKLSSMALIKINTGWIRPWHVSSTTSLCTAAAMCTVHAATVSVSWLVS